MNILRKAKNDVDSIVEAYIESTLKKIANYKEHLSLNGKNIEKANVEQAAYLAYYDEIRVDLKSLLSYYELKIKEVKAQSWKLLNDHKVASSDREKEILVNGNVTFLKVNRIYLEIKEMHDIVDGIVEQFKNRAYTLTNLTKIRVAALQDVTLYD